VNPASWPIRDRRVGNLWIIAWQENGATQYAEPGLPKRRHDDPGFVIPLSAEPCPCPNCTPQRTLGEVLGHILRKNEILDDVQYVTSDDAGTYRPRTPLPGTGGPSEPSIGDPGASCKSPPESGSFPVDEAFMRLLYPTAFPDAGD